MQLDPGDGAGGGRGGVRRESVLAFCHRLNKYLYRCVSAGHKPVGSWRERPPPPETNLCSREANVVYRVRTKCLAGASAALPAQRSRC